LSTRQQIVERVQHHLHNALPFIQLAMTYISYRNTIGIDVCPKNRRDVTLNTAIGLFTSTYPKKGEGKSEQGRDSSNV